MPFKEDELWNGYPEETNAPYGLAKKMLLVQSQAYREQYGYNSIFLLPVNLYGPGDNFDPGVVARDPGADPEVSSRRVERGAVEIVVWGDGSPTREFLYVDDAAEGSCWRRSATTTAEPVNLGSAIRDLDPGAGRAYCAATVGFEGPHRLGHESAERSAAAEARHGSGGV